MPTQIAELDSFSKVTQALKRIERIRKAHRLKESFVELDELVPTVSYYGKAKWNPKEKQWVRPRKVVERYRIIWTYAIDPERIPRGFLKGLKFK